MSTIKNIINNNEHTLSEQTIEGLLRANVYSTTYINSATYSITPTSQGIDYYGVSYSATCSINIGGTASNGKIIIIKDESGLASTNDIIISSTYSNIDNEPNYYISSNYGSLSIISRNNDWSILSFDGTTSGSGTSGSSGSSGSSGTSGTSGSSGSSGTSGTRGTSGTSGTSGSSGSSGSSGTSGISGSSGSSGTSGLILPAYGYLSESVGVTSSSFINFTASTNIFKDLEFTNGVTFSNMTQNIAKKSISIDPDYYGTYLVNYSLSLNSKADNTLFFRIKLKTDGGDTYGGYSYSDSLNESTVHPSGSGIFGIAEHTDITIEWTGSNAIPSIDLYAGSFTVTKIK